MVLAALAAASLATSPDALRAAAFAGPPAAHGEAPLPRGIARTAISRSFDHEKAEGAVGYLCGRKADLAPAGAAGARGVDHDGRFLGLQLKLSLR